MAPSAADLEMLKTYYRAKLLAEKQKVDVVRKVKEGKGDFVVIDTRDRESYAEAHIPGALNIPMSDVDTAAAKLSRDKEHVTYCWHST